MVSKRETERFPRGRKRVREDTREYLSICTPRNNVWCQRLNWTMVGLTARQTVCGTVGPMPLAFLSQNKLHTAKNKLIEAPLG